MIFDKKRMPLFFANRHTVCTYNYINIYYLFKFSCKKEGFFNYIIKNNY